MSDDFAHKPMRVPLNVLGSIHVRAGLGWEWTCNFKGCIEHGIRVDRVSCFTGLATHWRERHKATGGEQRK